MSETNKKEAGVQEETEKDLPETEPVTEPVEESPDFRRTSTDRRN